MRKTDVLFVIVVLGLVITSVLLALSKSGAYTINTVTQKENTVSVSGKSTVIIAPNEAELYVRIETFEDTAKEAKDTNANIADNVIKALMNKGVKKSDIETSQYNLYPMRDYDDTFGIEGYTVMNVLRVTIRELDNVGDLIDTAVNSGANGVDRVSFGLTKDKEKEVNSEALTKAAENSKEKAEAIVKGLNMDLGKIISITETSFGYITYERYGLDEAKAAGTSIIPENLEINANVNVVFEVS
jgi:hypothetical protein